MFYRPEIPSLVLRNKTFLVFFLEAQTVSVLRFFVMLNRSKTIPKSLNLMHRCFIFLYIFCEIDTTNHRV